MTDEVEDISGEYADALDALFDHQHLADMMAFPRGWSPSPPCTPFTVARRRGTAVTPAVADLLTRLAPIPVESCEAPNGATEVLEPRERPAPLLPGTVESIARGLRRFQELHPE